MERKAGGAYAQAEQESASSLTPEERAAITGLSQDLPVIWSAERRRIRKETGYCAWWSNRCKWME
jgi:hypothetical protein